MNIQTRYGWCGTALVILVMLAVPYAPALAASGTYITPSVTFGRGYDDNLFFTSTNEQADTFWRLSPAVEAGYESESLTLGGYFTQDAERYTDHKELDSNVARRNADINLSYQATSRLQLGLNGNYLSTNTPTDISPATGFATGRTRAKVYRVAPSLAYAYDALTTVGLGYLDLRQTLEGGVDTDLNATTLRFARDLSANDTLHAKFVNDLYDFGSAGSVTSRAFTLGWAHTVSEKTDFSVAAGPRDTEGDITAELAASLRHTLEDGAISVNYLRTQTEILGVSAPVEADVLTILFDYNVNPAIDIQLAPSAVRNSLNGSDADIYRLDLNARYKISDMLSLRASYQYNQQEGILGGASGVRVSENVFFFGVSFAFHPSQGDIFRKRQTLPSETLPTAPRR